MSQAQAEGILSVAQRRAFLAKTGGFDDSARLWCSCLVSAKMPCEIRDVMGATPGRTLERNDAKLFRAVDWRNRVTVAGTPRRNAEIEMSQFFRRPDRRLTAFHASLADGKNGWHFALPGFFCLRAAAICDFVTSSQLPIPPFMSWSVPISSQRFVRSAGLEALMGRRTIRDSLERSALLCKRRAISSLASK